MHRNMNQRPASGEAWYALRTKARHEKVVRQRLDRSRIETLLPTVLSTRQWNDRLAPVEMPLFPGYCFARFFLRDRIAVLNIPGVVQVVGGTVPSPVDEREIHAITTLLHSGIPLEPHRYLIEGLKVKVARGPLRGTVGILLQQRNACRLVIGVQLIHQAVSVHLAPEDIEPFSHDDPSSCTFEPSIVADIS